MRGLFFCFGWRSPDVASLCISFAGPMLSGRRILVGVSAGIAAYKSASLVRRLTGAGAEVRVVMTRNAREFVTPLTFQALCGHPVRDRLFDPEAEAGMDHIALARWAEAIVAAPASADLLARLAAGLADDLLTTLCLASEAPLFLAPAMNRAMWAHPATRANVQTLVARGAGIWGPADGEQACGESGAGRMLEPEELAQRLEAVLMPDPRLAGVSVLLTAGPTREPLDPVRFLGNRSSGRMGFALAGAFRDAGARVTLVSGPVSQPTPRGVERLDVETAEQMHAAVMQRTDDCAIFAGCAAVADYRPARAAPQKIKKTETGLTLELVRNPDILADVAGLPKPPFTLGFAAETGDLEHYAADKLRRKGIDMIAANLVGAEEGGFEREENALTVLWNEGRVTLPMAPKFELARKLVSITAERYDARN